MYRNYLNAIFVTWIYLLWRGRILSDSQLINIEPVLVYVIVNYRSYIAWLDISSWFLYNVYTIIVACYIVVYHNILSLLA